MDIYDGMYEAGFEDPQDYMDYLDREYEESYSQSASTYEEPEDEFACGQPFFCDFLASVSLKKILRHIRYTPKIFKLLDGHKCVVIRVSGVLVETGEEYIRDFWPFYEATEDDLINLPTQVDDFVLRGRFQMRIDEETGEKYLAHFYPASSWLSYSKSNLDDDVVLTGGRCKINYSLIDSLLSPDQDYLLARLSAEVTKEDKQKSWTDKSGCTYNSSKTKLLYCNRDIKEYDISPGTLCICNEAFKYCKNLECITIPPSVVLIGREVFYSCKQLKSITVPNSIFKIGRRAFAGCDNLNEVFFDDALKDDFKRVDFPEGLFETCKNLRRVRLPNYLNSIGYRMFSNCKKLEIVNIPKTIVKLDSYSFSGCESLVSVSLPSSLKIIKSGCFENCKSLVNLSFPDSVSIFEDGIFRACSNLRYVKLPKGISEIPRSTFECCSSLESFIIPDTVNTINNSAFAQCKNLKDIHIPNSVKEISSDAFWKCESIKRIVLPNSVTSIGDSAFRNCYSLASISIPNTVLYIGEEAFAFCSSLETLEIPDSVTRIEESAFSNCTSLKSIHLPVSLSSIRSYLLDDCTALKVIYMPKNAFVMGDFLAECKSLQTIIIPHGCDIDMYSDYLPKGVTVIEENYETNEQE